MSAMVGVCVLLCMCQWHVLGLGCLFVFVLGGGDPKRPTMLLLVDKESNHLGRLRVFLQGA